VTGQLLTEPSPLDHAAYKHREDLIDAVLCAWTAAFWHRYGLAHCQVLGPPIRGDGTAATIIAPTREQQRAPVAALRGGAGE
jgi:predicted RNase H-like nuclease